MKFVLFWDVFMPIKLYSYMDYKLLNDLVVAFTEYQQSLSEQGKSSMADFAIWLNRYHNLTEPSQDSSRQDMITSDDNNIEIGKLIVYLNRYAKLLIRKGLVGFPELVNEDFTYLYILMTAESMTKIQLIEQNIHEKPTGLEVIKRLIKYGLIAERNDETDKRSKRVFLTEKGKATFYMTLDQMNKVSRLLTGRLTNVEKKQLVVLLKKLEDFHNPLFLEHRSKNIDELEQLVGLDQKV